MGRKKFSADFQLMFRLLKLLLFVGLIGALVIFFIFLHLTVGDIFASLLAFLPTGWALLLVCSLSLSLSHTHTHCAYNFHIQKHVKKFHKMATSDNSICTHVGDFKLNPTVW